MRTIKLTRSEIDRAITRYVIDQHGLFLVGPNCKTKVVIHSRVHRKVYDDKKVVRILGASFKIGA